MILVATRNGPNAARLAAKVEELVARAAGGELRGFVMVIGSSPAQMRQLARAQPMVKAALCYPQPGREDVDLRRKLKINPEADNTVLVFRRFRVTANFVNVRHEEFAAVEEAALRAAQ